MTMKRMFKEMLTTSRYMKVISIITVASMLLTLTACGGTASQQDAVVTTESNSKMTQQPGAPEEPNQDIDDGADISEPTEDPNPSTGEPSSTEESPSDNGTVDNPPTGGEYTYDVDGVQITLRTNIDDYIVQDQWGGYGIDLIGIASSLGFHYEGLHPDEPEYQYTFYQDSNSNTSVTFSEEREQNFYEIEYFYGSDNYLRVTFSRNDVQNDSVLSYWISTSVNAKTKINYEQIVIFTFLMENAAFAPNEYWMENAGLSTTQNGYFIAK